MKTSINNKKVIINWDYTLKNHQDIIDLDIFALQLGIDEGVLKEYDVSYHDIENTLDNSIKWYTDSKINNTFELFYIDFNLVDECVENINIYVSIFNENSEKKKFFNSIESINIEVLDFDTKEKICTFSKKFEDNYNEIESIKVLEFTKNTNNWNMDNQLKEFNCNFNDIRLEYYENEDFEEEY